MRISDCSSDVCSSDLLLDALAQSREARRRYQEANDAAGELEASANIAAILVRLDRNRDEAEQLLGDSAAALKQSGEWGNLARVLFLRSELAERRGDIALVLDFRKQATGRASCREKVCHVVYISVVAASFTKKNNERTKQI